MQLLLNELRNGVKKVSVYGPSWKKKWAALPVILITVGKIQSIRKKLLVI
jgi:hypothetical protein